MSLLICSILCFYTDCGELVVWAASWVSASSWMAHTERVGHRWLSSTCVEEGDFFSTEVVGNEDYETAVEHHVTSIFRATLKWFTLMKRCYFLRLCVFSSLSVHFANIYASNNNNYEWFPLMNFFSFFLTVKRLHYEWCLMHLYS